MFIIHRIWLYYKTKDVEFKPGHEVEMNDLIQESPTGWSSEYKTRKNILLWILFGYKPWAKFYMLIKVKK